MSKEALIVFLKKPVEGKVKTRIGTAVGHSTAVAIYDKLLKKTADVVNGLRQDVFIFSDVHFDIPYFEKYIPKLQEGDGLGQKMCNSFSEVFKLGFQKVGIIGTDCFDLSTEVINDNFNELLNTDFVLGPSLDGGYYFLGMSKLSEEVFENIDWSTDKVLQQTVELIQLNGKSYTLGKKLSDVDEVSDVILYPELEKCLPKKSR